MKPPKLPLICQAQNTYDFVYRDNLGGLNRQQRRTLHGKLREQEAKIKALEAMNEFLKDHQNAN